MRKGTVKAHLVSWGDDELNKAFRKKSRGKRRLQYYFDAARTDSGIEISYKGKLERPKVSGCVKL